MHWLKSLPHDDVQNAASPSFTGSQSPQPHRLHRNRSKLNADARPFVPSRHQPTVLPPSSTDSAVQPFIRFDVGAADIPHPAKAHKGGEDAYFVGSDEMSIGIADGVGGWQAHGIDPGLYSRSLMQYAAAAAETVSDPLEVMKLAHMQCVNIQGSATACIISIRNGELQAANLGDSGFLVIRRGQVILKTKEQQHYFNCPLQIGSSRDMPGDADLISLAVEKGDIVILATDGLWDNLSQDRILEMVNEDLSLSSQALAKKLTDEAHRVASDPEARTPFEEGAKKNGQSWQGGKLDDITIVVARITDEPVSFVSSMETEPPKLYVQEGSPEPSRREQN